MTTFGCLDAHATRIPLPLSRTSSIHISLNVFSSATLLISVPTGAMILTSGRFTFLNTSHLMRLPSLPWNPKHPPLILSYMIHLHPSPLHFLNLLLQILPILQPTSTPSTTPHAIPTPTSPIYHHYIPPNPPQSPIPTKLNPFNDNLLTYRDP
jgi:hypothetical protein